MLDRLQRTYIFINVVVEIIQENKKFKHIHKIILHYDEEFGLDISDDKIIGKFKDHMIKETIQISNFNTSKTIDKKIIINRLDHKHYDYFDVKFKNRHIPGCIWLKR